MDETSSRASRPSFYLPLEIEGLPKEESKLVVMSEILIRINM